MGRMIGRRTSKSWLYKKSAGILVCPTYSSKDCPLTIPEAAAVLANGSVLVIGGQIGANDWPESNLEILPKPPGGSTVIELDWLARTNPNNLYPFVFVLPSGRIFVLYYNEARILDQHSFETVTELPNVPASVNNCKFSSRFSYMKLIWYKSWEDARTRSKVQQSCFPNMHHTRTPSQS
jgi:hypothetical protein